MTGRELLNKLTYCGQERSLRQILLKHKITTAEELAIMTKDEVCDIAAEHFILVYTEQEELGLVHKTKITEYTQLVNLISK